MGEQHRTTGAGRADGTVCARAALWLKGQSGLMGGDNPRVSVAAGQLMEALALALTHDPAAVPTRTRQAALRLARELQIAQRPPSESPASPSPQPGPTRCAKPDPPIPTATRKVPFTASVQLGRMG